MRKSINLTLLRTPLAPDMTADKGVQEFAYAFQCWNNAAFRDAGIVRSGYDFNVPATVQPRIGREAGGQHEPSIGALIRWEWPTGSLDYRSCPTASA